MAKEVILLCLLFLFFDCCICCQVAKEGENVTFNVTFMYDREPDIYWSLHEVDKTFSICEAGKKCEDFYKVSVTSLRRLDGKMYESTFFIQNATLDLFGEWRLNYGGASSQKDDVLLYSCILTKPDLNDFNYKYVAIPVIVIVLICFIGLMCFLYYKTGCQCAMKECIHRNVVRLKMCSQHIACMCKKNTINRTIFDNSTENKPFSSV
uniref:Immunoglobulin V-set domain-containing protein n=1 Tax=Biomphalaria glabrata TaxID=6526 RepID=A0A2C9LKX8_BIOGL